jgi:hypothetical protein
MHAAFFISLFNKDLTGNIHQRTRSHHTHTYKHENERRSCQQSLILWKHENLPSIRNREHRIPRHTHLAKWECSSGVVDSYRAPHTQDTKAVTAINSWSIFRAKICTTPARRTVNATMALDGASTLPVPAITRSRPRLRCTMPPRLVIDDV